MGDFCCLSQRAAKREAREDEQARKALLARRHTSSHLTTSSVSGSQETAPSDLLGGVPLPSDATQEQRAQMELAAQARSYQKSPRRLSPARRISRAPTTSSSVSGASTPEHASSASVPATPPPQQQRTAAQHARKASLCNDGNAKIILLGSGESGKSTFAKQMKVIHSGGFSEEEILAYRPEVLRNVIEAMQQVLIGMKRLGITFGGEQAQASKEWAEYVEGLHLEFEHLECLPQKTIEAVGYLWIESGIRNHFDRLTHVSFFDEVERFGRPDFIPTTQDILKARTKTTGITKTTFKSGMLRIDMFDVGGQRTERRRWVQVFENATTVIFCVALSEYDQLLAEDPRQNRLVESFQLFDNIVNSRWFHHSSIVLFLNKTDVFRQKLRTSPLSDYFPDYTGGADYDRATEFVRDRFLRLNRAGLAVYPFLTCATDTANVNVVFAAVKETVLRNVLISTGLV